MSTLRTTPANSLSTWILYIFRPPRMRGLGRALWIWLKKLIALLKRLIGITSTTYSEPKVSWAEKRTSIMVGDMGFELRDSRLLALPAELRNSIWELVFAPNTGSWSSCKHGHTNLLDAKVPPLDLLLVCKQIYREACGFHADAVSRYWPETRFFIHCGEFAKQKTSKSLMERLSAIDERDIGQIQHLAICGPGDKCSIPTMQLHRGMWRQTSHCPIHPQRVVPKYVALVSKQFWNIVFDYNLVFVNNQTNYEATKGQTFPCLLWSTPGGEAAQDQAEVFHVMKTDCTDRNVLFTRVVQEEMGQKVLTKEWIRAAVRSHIQMAQQ